MLKRTPFYDFHVAAGAKLVDFAGWEMPILYRGIVEEHEQTRRSGAVFDVSHMGRLSFSGPDTQLFLSHVLSRNIANQTVGQSRYSLVCNEAGGVLDDIIISREAKGWIMVCNASNREKLVRHFTDIRQSEGYDFDMADHTESTAMLAIQGPRVIDTLVPLLPIELLDLKRYRFETATIMGFRVLVYRSGYTGEDGVEIVMPAKMAAMGIDMLRSAMNTDQTILPAGLGARDTLRLEAGMPLYGHELTESTDPISAGLAWAVDLQKTFVGVEPLRKIQQAGPARRLVGLELEGKRIARQGAAVTADGSPVGAVSSGTFSPTFQKSIAMAFVNAENAAEGAQLGVELRGGSDRARVVKLPFYRRK